MKTWFQMKACLSHGHCASCRGDEAFRLSLFAAGRVAERDFACPAGFTAERLPEKGDVPAVVEKARKVSRCCGQSGSKRFNSAEPPETANT